MESVIRTLPGVLECAILTQGESGPESVQVFIRPDADRPALEDTINREIEQRYAGGASPQVYVFTLDAQPRPGHWDVLERLAEEAARQGSKPEVPSVAEPAARRSPAAPPTGAASRPPLLRVAFSTSGTTSEAEVALGGSDQEVVGHAHGGKTPHGLSVLAEATLQAASRLAGDPGGITLIGASLVRAVGRDAVMVLVQENGEPLVGAALVGDRPQAEAAVRATLDAINRRLARGLAQGEERH